LHLSASGGVWILGYFLIKKKVGINLLLLNMEMD